MTALDFIIQTIGTIAGWAAIILGLAWAAGRGRSCDLHIHMPPAGGNGGGGRRPVPRFPGGRYDAGRIYTADDWRARRRNSRLP